MLEFLSQPWPWYVAGPLLGLMVPTLLLIGGKHLGISNNFRHACTAVMPGDINFFRYNWKQDGLWNLIFAAGILLGAVVAANFLGSGNPLPVSDATIADLAALGIMDTTGLVPKQVFSLEGLMTLRGFLMMTVGGFLVGFGARYSGGCTSGHAIFGMANLQLPSLIAVIGFFAGGLLCTIGSLFWDRPQQERGHLLVSYSGNVSVSVVPHVRDHRLRRGGRGDISLPDQEISTLRHRWE